MDVSKRRQKEKEIEKIEEKGDGRRRGKKGVEGKR